MSAIHWLGAGLSSGPGIVRLGNSVKEFIVWNRTLKKAQDLLQGCAFGKAQKLDFNQLKSSLSAGDIVVSMLPADRHPHIAQICLEENAHFVCSSYISPQMQAFDEKATAKGLCFVNEVGLDPGLDHLLAHDLIHRYQHSEMSDKNHKHYFRSYCGGFPETPGDFKYKFSWSPLGVLRALKTPAHWIEEGKEKFTPKPWLALSGYQAPLPSRTEHFEIYPNRDSRPFVKQYHLQDGWNITQFVRGTLRLEGWSQAWEEIFNTIDKLKASQAEDVLGNLSEELWKKYAYEKDEPDRVVLCVELEVRDTSNKKIWHESYTLDEVGGEKGSAMARLVSLPMSLAVESVLAGILPTGVSAAPHKNNLIHEWFSKLKGMGESIHHKVHTAS